MEDHAQMERTGTFLHTNDTEGLCTAYRVITSSILEYSSDELRSADFRVGIL